MKLLKPKTVANMLHMSLGTLYRRVKEPDFPPRVRLSKQIVRFREEDVLNYIDEVTEEKEAVEK